MRKRFWVVALFLCASPVTAGDSVGSALWPKEGPYRQTVIETTCQELQDCCGLHLECGDWYQRPRDPAPVPLPPSLLLLTAAIAALALKGKHYV